MIAIELVLKTVIIPYTKNKCTVIILSVYLSFKSF